MRKRPVATCRLLAVLPGLLLLSWTLVTAPRALAEGKKKAAAAKTARKAEPPKPAAGHAESSKSFPYSGRTLRSFGTFASFQRQPFTAIERGAGGKKVYKIEGEIVIEGKIQKPEAFYVLQKSSINYDWHELKQEFAPKILDSVTKAPF